jgi:hypothetical protein
VKTDSIFSLSTSIVVVLVDADVVEFKVGNQNAHDVAPASLRYDSILINVIVVVVRIEESSTIVYRSNRRHAALVTIEFDDGERSIAAFARSASSLFSVRFQLKQTLYCYFFAVCF